DTEAEARELAARLAGLPGQVRSVTGKTEKKKPELLYDLTTLQKEANKRFGFTAEHTLAVAQDLYEAKLLSYPRTNSRHLTKADEAKAAGWLKALAQGQLGDLKPFLEELRGRWPAKLDKRFVDDAQVEDHSALVPTETPAQGLSGDRLKVYELVARRFLAAYFPERVEAKTAVVTVIAEETFKTNGTVVKELGWSAVDPPHARPRKEKKAKEADPDAEEPEADEPEEEAGTLPPLARKQAVEVKDLLPKAGKTTPPKRMSEADLLAAMQGAGRELDDDELKGAMKDRGLGTPATRAGIIETLLKRGYLARKRNILQPTDKGMALITGLKAESLTSPQMTGAWEARLERMRRGEDTREAFMGDVKGFVAELVGQIRASSPAAAPRPVTGPVVGACPGCGGSLHLRTWEGRSYVRCGGDGCRVAYDTDAEGQPLERCPCGGPMRTFKDGGKACVVCGAREGEPAAPAPRPCPTCGQPMRVIPSTRRGQWFQRCSPCGITEAG
ncbi:MAG TPA: DNA topoisomerase, partial [Holophaga sp.]|nr:DNA topoisomerase [Holophaga sp.]